MPTTDYRTLLVYCLMKHGCPVHLVLSLLPYFTELFPANLLTPKTSSVFLAGYYFYAKGKKMSIAISQSKIVNVLANRSIYECESQLHCLVGYPPPIDLRPIRFGPCPSAWPISVKSDEASVYLYRSRLSMIKGLSSLWSCFAIHIYMTEELIQQYKEGGALAFWESHDWFRREDHFLYKSLFISVDGFSESSLRFEPQLEADLVCADSGPC